MQPRLHAFLGSAGSLLDSTIGPITQQSVSVLCLNNTPTYQAVYASVLCYIQVGATQQWSLSSLSLETLVAITLGQPPPGIDPKGLGLSVEIAFRDALKFMEQALADDGSTTGVPGAGNCFGEAGRVSTARPSRTSRSLGRPYSAMQSASCLTRVWVASSGMVFCSVSSQVV